jgi:hypothetical protein
VIVCEAGIHGKKQDLHGHGFDRCRRVVGLGVQEELLAETEIYFAKQAVVRAGGPQAFKPLPHGTEGCLHCVRLDKLTAGGNFAQAISRRIGSPTSMRLGSMWSWTQKCLCQTTQVLLLTLTLDRTMPRQAAC